MSLSDWKANLEKERETKYAFSAENWQSPIHLQDRPEFKGLQCYTPDLTYRFELELYEHSEKEIVRMAYTKGNEKDLIRWGEFRFKIVGEELSLQAYKHSREEDTLFIPFKDTMFGKETYEAGRYLYLESGRNSTQEGKWILGFYQAYNP